jgi:hypothetical protein
MSCDVFSAPPPVPTRPPLSLLASQTLPVSNVERLVTLIQ